MKEDLKEVMEHIGRASLLSVEGNCDKLFGNVVRLAHNCLDCF